VTANALFGRGKMRSLIGKDAGDIDEAGLAAKKVAG
jgi:hypothetical protein